MRQVKRLFIHHVLNTVHVPEMLEYLLLSRLVVSLICDTKYTAVQWGFGLLVLKKKRQNNDFRYVDSALVNCDGHFLLVVSENINTLEHDDVINF